MENSKYRLAVSLEYNSAKDLAPRIGLKGESLNADQIVKLAKRFGIPVVEKDELARALSVLDVDDYVSEHLYEAVAVVLSHIDKKT